MSYDSLHNITRKTQAHDKESTQGSGVWAAEPKTSYDWNYAYKVGVQPHAASAIGDRTFTYDADGSQTVWKNTANTLTRNLVWDEEKRIRSITDSSGTQKYLYDANGDRVYIGGNSSETAYVNAFFVVRDGSVASKHAPVQRHVVLDWQLSHASVAGRFASASC